MPVAPGAHRIIGFAIQPAQSLSDLDTKGLHGDIISLLSSMTYHPTNISKVTLDLRYVLSRASSLTLKVLDIVLLIRIDFSPALSEPETLVVLERFRAGFSDLLSLHLLQYEFEIIPLLPSEVTRFLAPFKPTSIVEITRRITSYRPFGLTTFKGASPMTKVVDMLLREEGQCILSVSLEPHLLSDEEVRELEVFGYQNPVLQGRHGRDDEFLESILNIQQIKQSMQSVFRMTIRLASDIAVSQYLVNLVGSEISGQRDFYYFRVVDSDLPKETAGLVTLEQTSGFKNVVGIELPPILLDLVYLFRPEEAVSAFRLPTQRISAAQEKAFKTYPAPVRLLPNEGLLLGTATHPSYKDSLPVYISKDDRARHVYIIGKTGTGKSYQLLNMIRQDIVNEGLCVIDPHGDLIDALWACIPESRIDDVHYFNPGDKGRVVGFNFLETPPSAEESDRDNDRDYVVQELVAMLSRMVDYDQNMYGPMAQQWTRFACLALMELDPPGTLVDVPRLVFDDGFRKAVIAQIKTPSTRQWWEGEFPSYPQTYRNEFLGYFTSKFTPLVSAPQVRNILGQSHSTINFTEIMDEGKILFVNLSSGLVGKANSNLLGSLLVSRILWTALRRARDPVAGRRQFFLYVDEFQNFLTESFEQILSEARKYGLSLTIAHQHLDQLKSIGRLGDKIRRAVFGNVGTMIAFRVGTDAKELAEEFGNPTESSSLRNLANRHAVGTMQVGGVPSTPFTMRTTDWEPPTAKMIGVGARILQRARERATPVSEVVEGIKARLTSTPTARGSGVA